MRFADHLVTAILDGAPIAPAATFADGLQVQKVLDAVRVSGQGWQEISPGPLRPGGHAPAKDNSRTSTIGVPYAIRMPYSHVNSLPTAVMSFSSDKKFPAMAKFSTG